MIETFLADIRRVVGISLLALAGLPPSQATSTTVLPMTLQEVSKSAGYIFSGRVANVKMELSKEPRSPITRVEFVDLDVRIGRKAPKLVLILIGGTAGGKSVEFVGQPTFERGKRYIIAAHGDLGSTFTHITPIIGLFQGLFMVEPNAAGNGEVYDAMHRPIAKIRNHRLVVVRRPVGPRESLDEFVDIVSDTGERLSEQGLLDEMELLAKSR